MRELFEGLRWNDRTKLLVSAVATGAVVLFAILFPLTFRQSGAQTVPAAATLEERTALFTEYWNAGDGAEGISVTKEETPEQERTELCAARMQGIIAACIADENLADASPTGSEYTSVSDGVTQVNVCRMWMERSGDWKNWLDVCFDADTGEIYYLYLSCECLSNAERYALPMDTQRAAEKLAALQDGTLRYLGPGEAGGQTAVIAAPCGTIIYTVDCTAYDTLVDVKINCL